MPKMLCLHNMAHRYGAGLLISTYIVLGIALVPITLLPEMSTVQNVYIKECHKSCHKGSDGRLYCTTQCSHRDTPTRTLTYDKPGGSTGPTKPPVPPKTGGSKHQ
jgi:hypothetical protein